MIVFRTRRSSTLRLSVLTVILTCCTGSLFAQASPDSWPFNEESAPMAQPKSAVQKQLELLYQKDGRQMPDYMRNNGQQPGNNASATPQQQQMMSPQGYSSAPQAAPGGQMPSQQATPQQRTRMPSSDQNIRQDLSDYYRSQGRTMPRAQYGGANQTVVVDDGHAAPPKPRLIDRLNPFRRFSQKETADKSSKIAPRNSVTAATQGPPYQQPASDRNAPAPPGWSDNGFAPQQSPSGMRQSMNISQPSALPNSSSYANQPAVPRSAPPVVAAQQPSSSAISVSLGSSQPMRVTSATPAAPGLVPQTVASAGTDVPARPDVTVQQETPVRPEAGGQPNAPAVPNDPANQAAAGPDALRTASVSSPTASPDDTSSEETVNPFKEVSEAEADKISTPYTGLTLQEENNAAAARKSANAKPAMPTQSAPPAVDGRQANSVTPPAANTSATPKQPALASEQKHIQPKALPAIETSSEAPKEFVEREPATRSVESHQNTTVKMRKIGARVGQRGLKGFCPVVLRDRRDLVDANPHYYSIYESKIYCFSSASAKKEFDRSPDRYAPVAGGIDVVVKTNSDQEIDGMLDYGAWYKDRLFLFSSPESVEAFSHNPQSYAAAYVNIH